MVESLEILERSEAHGHVPAPALVIIPDRDAEHDVRTPVLGRPAFERSIAAAAAAGFAQVVLAPGTRLPIAEPEPMADDAEAEAARTDAAYGVPVSTLASGEPLRRPALVVFEGTLVERTLLPLMVAHPLDPDERYTLYDDVGRPAASFFGHLERVPTMIPLTEELPWPDGFGPADVVRQVYPDDRSRAEALALRSEKLEVLSEPGWRRRVVLPTLRWLASGGRPLAQLNLLGMLLITGCLPLSLLGGWVGWVLAAASLLLGVHVTSLIEVVGQVRGLAVETAASVDLRLAAAARPLGHAALMVGLTYAIVAQTDRSQVAAVVELIAGAGAVVLSLLQARLLLRGRPADIFALPDAEAAAGRLGVRWWPGLRGAPLLELSVCLASLTGIPELPWSILATGALARLWRWFAGPPISLRDAVGEPSPD